MYKIKIYLPHPENHTAGVGVSIVCLQNFVVCIRYKNWIDWCVCWDQTFPAHSNTAKRKSVTILFYQTVYLQKNTWFSKNAADCNGNLHISRKSIMWENILNFNLISELSVLCKTKGQWNSTQKYHHYAYKCSQLGRLQKKHSLL